MPRDPKDISATAGQRTQRRIGELDDAKDPIRLRVGAGPAGAEGKEGKEGAAGRSNGLRYVFLTNTENTDPTSGRIKLNNATPTSATAIRISETDADGNAIGAYVNAWDDSTSTVRGQIIIRSIATKTDLLVYNVTGALTDNGTWDSLVVTSVVGTGTFSNNEEVTVEFIRTGDEGKEGKEGKPGAEGPAGSVENSDWKNSVRAATTANITIATALNPGDVLDGVTLAENDRVLVKNQTTTKENGIWVVKASPSRALDADAAAELSGGSTIYVEEGTRNKRRTFQIITPGNITPGTTAHEYQQLGFRDFGIVAALPTSEAVKNDKCQYQAAGEMTEKGIVWQLVYDDGGEYPWKKVGGPPLVASSNNQRSLTNKAAYESLATDPLSIVAPLKGDYDITIAAFINMSGTTNATGVISYAVGAVAASDKWAAAAVNPATGVMGANVSCTTRQEEVIATASIAEKARTEAAGGTVNFTRRRLLIDPIRVG